MGLLVWLLIFSFGLGLSSPEGVTSPLLGARLWDCPRLTHFNVGSVLLRSVPGLASLWMPPD